MHEQDTTAVVQHEGASSQPGLFTIDPGMTIWTWVVFGALVIILRKFAWKPMMDSVEKRERTMAMAVEQAQKTKEELDKIAITQREILKKASDEAQQIIDSGKSAAESVAQSIHEKAALDAKQEMEHAREQIVMEKERALREIKAQSVDIIIAASEKLIGESLDDESHKRIVKKHLEEL